MRSMNEVLQLAVLLAVGAFSTEKGLGALPADSASPAVPVNTEQAYLECGCFPENIQQPTSNAQHPVTALERDAATIDENSNTRSRDPKLNFGAFRRLVTFLVQDTGNAYRIWIVF